MPTSRESDVGVPGAAFPASAFAAASEEVFADLARVADIVQTPGQLAVSRLRREDSVDDLFATLDQIWDVNDALAE